MAPDEALQITRRLLALVDQMDAQPVVIALAMIGAGIMLLSESDPETAEVLADVLQSGAFRH